MCPVCNPVDQRYWLSYKLEITCDWSKPSYIFSRRGFLVAGGAALVGAAMSAQTAPEHRLCVASERTRSHWETRCPTERYATKLFTAHRREHIRGIRRFSAIDRRRPILG